MAFCDCFDIGPAISKLDKFVRRSIGIAKVSIDHWSAQIKAGIADFSAKAMQLESRIFSSNAKCSDTSTPLTNFPIKWFCYSLQPNFSFSFYMPRMTHVDRWMSRETRLRLRFMRNCVFWSVFSTTYRSSFRLRLLSLSSILGLTACTALYRNCIEYTAKRRDNGNTSEALCGIQRTQKPDSEIHLSSVMLQLFSANWCFCTVTYFSQEMARSWPSSDQAKTISTNRG